MMLAPTTLHKLPAIPMPYVDEVARITLHRAGRRPLMLDLYQANRWLYHQDALARVELARLAAVAESQPAEPDCNQTFTYSAVAFHGWRKLAWYVIGLLDNVCHIGRVAA